MKNTNMIGKLSLVAALGMSLVLAPIVSATRGTQPQRKEIGTEVAIPAPVGCGNAGVKYTELIGGVDDAFALAAEATTQSTGLQAFFNANNITPRQFDEVNVNKGFGHSFLLPCCQVCRAQLEISVKELATGASAGDNDSITIGQAPFTPNTQERILSEHIWPNSPPLPPPSWAGSGNPKIMTIPLPAATLNAYIKRGSKGDRCLVPLDIYLQDDTAVDYVKLKLWTTCFTADVKNVCCLGVDAQNHPIYAFSFLVNNPLPYQASLTVTTPSGTVLGGYGPHVVPPGQTVVTGTFTWLLPPNVSPPPGTQFCLVFQLATKGGGKLTTRTCFKPPCGPGVDQTDNPS